MIMMINTLGTVSEGALNGMDRPKAATKQSQQATTIQGFKLHLIVPCGTSLTIESATLLLVDPRKAWRRGLCVMSWRWSRMGGRDGQG
jgi:hypothetical protein